MPVGSLIAILAKKEPEVAIINCLDYVENAADKLSAATWRIAARVRGAKDDDATLIRHVYDLALLKDAVIGDPNFVELVRTTMEADRERTKDENFARLSIAEKGRKLISILEEDPLYAGEYQKFVAGLSYASVDEVPDFTHALTALRVLVSHLT